MSHIPYIVFYNDANGCPQTITCDSEKQAYEEASEVLLKQPECHWINIYALQDSARRQQRVVWSLREKAPPKKKQPARRRWTKEENWYLRTALEAGNSYRDIAEKLDRSTHAVETQASRLRCVLDT